MRTASKFGAILPNFHQIPAYVALFREKSLKHLKIDDYYIIIVFLLVAV